MPNRHIPPPGWTIIGGVLHADRSIRGYYQRRQDAAGRCFQKDCRRHCHIDVGRLHALGMGAVQLSQIARSFQCNRLDGCALEFPTDPRAESLSLDALCDRPAVAVKISCAGCGASRRAAPATVIAGLQREGKGDGRTRTAELPALLTSPCKACGKQSWTVQVAWPDYQTLGGRKSIDQARAKPSSIPKDPLEF